MEFRVNTYFDLWQRSPDVTVLESGDLVVVWDSFFSQGDLDRYYIAFQRYSASGVPLGTESIVSDVGLDARYARVDALEDGGFAVAWEASTSFPSAENQIYTRAYNADGTARGDIVRVNALTNSDDHYGAEVVATSQGYFVFYTGEHIPFVDDETRDEVYFRTYTNDGTVISGPQRVSGLQDFDQQVPRGTTLSNGNVVVIWDSENTSLFDGIPGTAFDDRFFRIYAPDGTPLTPEIRFSNSNVNGTFNVSVTDISVAALQNGRFVVVWAEFLGDGTHSVRGRIYAENGQLERDTFNIALTDQKTDASAVEALDGGGFVVAWDERTAGAFEDVFARVYYEDGTPHSDVFIVPDFLDQEQVRPSIAAVPGGGFFITWESEDIDPDRSGISGKFYAPPDGLAQGLVLNGTVGADVLEGAAGNDTINGFAGFDTLSGGFGNDVISGGDNADLLLGGAGEDTLSGGNGFDVIEGGDGDDVINAGSSPDRVDGGAGDDLIRAGSNFGNSVDGVDGGAGNDTIFGDAGFDLLLGGDGNDSLDGGAQADNLYGNNGNDTLIGGAGFDRLFGGTGDDLLQDLDGVGGLFGGFGNDTLLNGGDGNTFFAGSGNDLIEAGGGDDIVNGNAGFDTIDGGTGNDVLRGQFNADIFLFADGHGQDTVTDFDASNAFEKLDFSGVSGISGLSDLNLGSGTQGAACQVGADVLIDTGGGNSVLLLGVSLSDLDASDFVF